MARDPNDPGTLDLHTAPTLFGYARVSTSAQDLHLQREALGQAGCYKIFEEKISGVKRGRPQLERMLEQLRPNDVIVVTRLDRLARSTIDLVGIVALIKESGAGLRSLAEAWIDTSSPAGKMMLTVMAGLAEFERDLILERTSSGRNEAKRRGVKFGRKRSLNDQKEGWQGFIQKPAFAVLSH